MSVICWLTVGRHFTNSRLTDLLGELFFNFTKFSLWVCKVCFLWLNILKKIIKYVEVGRITLFLLVKKFSMYFISRNWQNCIYEAISSWFSKKLGALSLKILPKNSQQIPELHEFIFYDHITTLLYSIWWNFLRWGLWKIATLTQALIPILDFWFHSIHFRLVYVRASKQVVV